MKKWIKCQVTNLYYSLLSLKKAGFAQPLDPRTIKSIKHRFGADGSASILFLR